MLTIIVTFHSEKFLAHLTLLSILRCVEYCTINNIHVLLYILLDNADDVTTSVVRTYNYQDVSIRIESVSFGDVAVARNYACSKIRSKYIAICDGDDYYSRNWFTNAIKYLEYTPHINPLKLIVHPEYMITFGTTWTYAKQVSTSDKRPLVGLFSDNWWGVWSVANSEVYKKYPFRSHVPQSNGFGFEDWHWNCETIAANIEHHSIPETAGFYRRKNRSRNVTALSYSSIIHFTNLFTTSFLRDHTL